MGKKRVAQKTKEEILAEKEKLDKTLEKKAKVSSKKKRVRKGNIYVNASYTNTRISLTDKKGNVLAWSSAGSLGFKGTKKSTSYAASKVAEVIAKKCEVLGVEEVEVFVKGLGPGRSSTLRTLVNFKLIINAVEDATPIPHNGCRPPKARRV